MLEVLKTRRTKARYGDRGVYNGIPVAVFKSGKRKDIMTAEEIAEDIYQRPVDHIVFKDISDPRQ